MNEETSENTTEPQASDTPVRRNLATAVGGIWEKFRGVTLDRVTTLEQAAVAQLEGELGPELRRRAEREAHKLAGAVGTFGFTRGSDLAREAEQILSGSNPLTQAQTLRLSALTVSLRQELERPPQPIATPSDDRPLLLVIDEDREFTDLLSMEAEGRGMAVRVADRMTDVHAALATDNPSVVILDPFFAGSTEAGMRLLSEMTTRAPSRPVLVAAWGAGFTNRVDAARFGAHTFLQKPVPPAQAVDAAFQAMQQREVTGTVVAVDDDPRILETIQTLLEPTGLKVVTVQDPRDFWETMKETPPDVAVLDVDMPHVSGVELCRVIRNDSRWSTTPVIFLTARTDPETIHQVFAAGADDFVAKPIVGPELTTRIENRLERVRLYRLLADTDALTGIANRRKAEENITRLIGLAARQRLPVSLAIIDMDNFKRINDQFGHAVGDDVLRRVSKRLRNTLRGEDVIGRWGGEEFLVGAFGADKHVLVRRLTEVLTALRTEGVTVGSEVLPLTFSGGVAEFPADGPDLGTLYRLADAVLYEAKSQGRDRVLPTGWSLEQVAGPEHVDVLLVDDDPVLVQLLEHALTTHGYTHRRLGDGEAAMEALIGKHPTIRARVILLDVNLPGRDGLGVLQELAKDGVTDRTRVIMLTARSTEAEVVRSLELGAVDHVAKPFSVPILMRKIHRALRRD